MHFYPSNSSLAHNNEDDDNNYNNSHSDDEGGCYLRPVGGKRHASQVVFQLADGRIGVNLLEIAVCMLQLDCETALQQVPSKPCLSIFNAQDM